MQISHNALISHLDTLEKTQVLENAGFELLEFFERFWIVGE
jgi:hypothetical protein